jgi:hypothetical protein
VEKLAQSKRIHEHSASVSPEIGAFFVLTFTLDDVKMATLWQSKS